MDYLISTDRKQLEGFQTKVDVELGYPEQEHEFINVGYGPHCHWTVGRALHYAPIEEHKDGGVFALPAIEGIEIPTGATKGKLPADWYPVAVGP